MFGVSFPELIIILAIMLVFIGPKRLPEIARTLGKIMGELRRQSETLRREFYNSVYEPAEEAKRSLEMANRELTTWKEQISEEMKPHPLCPDSQKKLDAEAEIAKLQSEVKLEQSETSKENQPETPKPTTVAKEEQNG